MGVHFDQAASRYLSLEDARTLLMRGFEAWTTAGGACVPSITVVPLAPVQAPEIGVDVNGRNENDVVFHDDSWPYPAPAGDTDGLATVTFDKKTGEIVDGDIEVNGARLSALLTQADGAVSDPTSSNDLRLIFTHFAGHFLGFSHSQDPTSVMSAAFAPGASKAPELSADDAAGMCAVYPPSGQRSVIDAQGQQALIPATACTLTASGAAGAGDAGAAGGCGSGPVQLDHGCSIGPRSRVRGTAPLSVFGVGLAALLYGSARRRRRW